MNAEQVRVLRERDDVAMMEHVELWPRWPVLPVKRYGPTWQQGDLPEMGVLAACEEHRHTVFLDVMLFGMDGDALKDAKRKEYDSFQAIVDDGWVVD